MHFTSELLFNQKLDIKMGMNWTRTTGDANNIARTTLGTKRQKKMGETTIDLDEEQGERGRAKRDGMAIMVGCNCTWERLKWMEEFSESEWP